MQNHALNQEVENYSTEVAHEALGNSFARWTDKSDQPMTGE
jgi:hypothetical protein